MEEGQLAKWFLKKGKNDGKSFGILRESASAIAAAAFAVSIFLQCRCAHSLVLTVLSSRGPSLSPEASAQLFLQVQQPCSAQAPAESGCVPAALIGEFPFIILMYKADRLLELVKARVQLLSRCGN